MKKIKIFFTIAFFVIPILAGGLSFADQRRGERTYEVTITNLTRGQIISPPIVISHDENFRLFTLGEPASHELYPLAEDGDTVPLTDHIKTLPSVFDYAVAAPLVGPSPLFPGESVTYEIGTRGRARFISAAGMLVTTNDAFFAIQGIRVPKKGETVVDAAAYDAGSEANSEDCDFIPGPPCGNGGFRDTGDAEGYVHIHAGIHGIDIDDMVIPAMHDWRNPVAKITIRRLR